MFDSFVGHDKRRRGNGNGDVANGSKMTASRCAHFVSFRFISFRLFAAAVEIYIDTAFSYCVLGFL